MGSVPSKPWGVTPARDAERAVAATLISPRGVLGLARRQKARFERGRRLAAYSRGGRLPWSEGYADAKLATIERALADRDLQERLRDHTPLPASYGERLDERVIEYPWVLARLSTKPWRLLDAGSTLNHHLFLDHPSVRVKRITITTLAPEPVCFWQRGISYDFEDLRELPYRDSTFDEIVCISTLEHVGMDNRMYGATGSGGGDFTSAARELARVLKPGGELLITVPFGRADDLGFQRIFDSNAVRRLLGSIDPVTATVHYYRYTSSGWIAADESSCEGCVYFNVHDRGYGSASVRYDADFAAAARAVACIAATRRP